MNVENFATESQQPLDPQAYADPAADQTLEITPLPFETFRLIGGGSSVILD